jgi:hypothetical protein
MIRKQFPIALLALLFVCSHDLNAQSVVTFEDIGATLADESFYNGSDDAGGFSSGPLAFNNSYNEEFESWSGWSYSNQTDTTTPGFGNQYSNIVGLGDSGSATYAVAFGNTAEIQSSSGAIESLSITNTTYAALSMRDGDPFAKQFGGSSGDDPDFFKIDILSLNQAGEEVDSLEFFLADYRFSDNSQDYIVDNWTTVDVSELNARRIGFRFSSSDVGTFGINTPLYFAVDNLVVAVPEPATGSAILLLALTMSTRRKRC